MIETIASYITILELLERGLKYWQRARRRAFRDSVRALKNSKPAHEGEVRALLESVLSRDLNAGQYSAVRRDLQYIEPVRACLARMISGTSAFSPISYATALQEIAVVIGHQLESCKAFNLFGRDLEHSRTCLVFPHTWSAIRLWSPIANKLRLVLRLKGKAYLVRVPYSSGPRPFHYCLAIHMEEKKKATSVVNISPSRDFQFSLHGDGRLVNGCALLSTKAKAGEQAFAICTLRHVDFSRLLRGLLLDYLCWAQRVWNEAQAAATSVRQMHGDLSRKTHNPAAPADQKAPLPGR
jgi:hypothetical protein